MDSPEKRTTARRLMQDVLQSGEARISFQVVALSIAAALTSGCTRLLSEDLQHGQRIEGLRIENPFIAG
jgi:hypothetical protein